MDKLGGLWSVGKGEGKGKTQGLTTDSPTLFWMRALMTSTGAHRATLSVPAEKDDIICVMGPSSSGVFRTKVRLNTSYLRAERRRSAKTPDRETRRNKEERGSARSQLRRVHEHASKHDR